MLLQCQTGKNAYDARYAWHSGTIVLRILVDIRHNMSCAKVGASRAWNYRHTALAGGRLCTASNPFFAKRSAEYLLRADPKKPNDLKKGCPPACWVGNLVQLLVCRVWLSVWMGGVPRVSLCYYCGNIVRPVRHEEEDRHFCRDG